MRKKMPMTAWYNPGLLVQTGIRVAISTVFGEMADRREAMAAANGIAAQPFDKSFDYSRRGRDGAFWFDFLADTGDGWDSTFAIAQLVTKPQLEPEGAPELPRGRVQILGGDLVYPTASREEYDSRFLYPFEEARERLDPDGRADMPDLYAIPGNHDWYDGLGAFFSLFCRRRIAAGPTVGVDRPGRRIAGRPTQQTRSYFAIRLAEGWWLWGIDSQLKGYIDQPQIDFFQFVASRWMEDNSKLILCVGMPNWAYVDQERPEKEFETFSYLERLAGMARVPLTQAQAEAGVSIETQPLKGHQLKLVLTGDSHHYSRFVEPRADGQEPIHYITCGGGGAFLHPTHHLRDKEFAWDYPPPGVVGSRIERGYSRRFEIAVKAGGSQEKALFPDAETSRGLTSGNARFALKNWNMTGVFVVAYLLFNWILNTNAQVEGYSSLLQGLGVGPWYEAPLRYVWIAFASPWPTVLFAAAMGAYYYFADSPHDWKTRAGIGVGHGLIQAGGATLVTSLILWTIAALFSNSIPSLGLWPSLGVGASILLASLVAALVSATIFGLYLWANLNRWSRHWNEAFSSLANQHFKCFLRMKIGRDGKLEVYPIGLDTVPEGGGTIGSSGADRLKPHLIEGPIVIS
jgi:hypothetical protein